MRKSSLFLAAIAAASLFAGILSSCGGNGSSYSTSPPPTGGNGELSGNLSAGGGVYAHTFNTVGTFNYHCSIHPSCTSLQGHVTVVDAQTPIANPVTAIGFSGGSAGTYATCSSLSNQADTVHVGQQVTWTNNSPLPHTVISN